MLKHYEDSRRFLTENPELVCEDTANHLVVWCIDLEIEEVTLSLSLIFHTFVLFLIKSLSYDKNIQKKKDLMEHVAHQCIVMQFILELSKTLKYDPRACVTPFFSKMQVANKEYKDGFFDELNSFKDRVRKRAQEKIEAAMKEAEEEERKARLGPGGLDPVEVFETLPDELKKCFESQDIQLLQDTLLAMKKEDAEYHMNRCVKSGLWVPDANTKQRLGKGDDDASADVPPPTGDEKKVTTNDEETYSELATDTEKK